MPEMKRFLCVIPARGGSKRLPRKNIMPLDGKPLIHYAIAAARESGVFDKVLVSTEDPEILDVAKGLGADIRRRPGEFATDTATSLSVVLDALDSEEQDHGAAYEYVCELPPTAPLRTAGDIRRAGEMMTDCDASFVVGVTNAEPPPHIAMSLNPDNSVEPLFHADYFKLRRQDMPASFCPNGSIYMAEVAALRRGLDFYEARTLGYAMPPERSVNIDTAMDFALARLMMEDIS